MLLQLLWNRNIKTQEEIDVFLGADWSRDTFDPFLFLKMSAAVARVFAAFEKKETITVHGDYDADGVCGSALLIVTLREIARALNYDSTCITHYIPHREREGYGMSVDTVLELSQKTKLIITVDCGISNKTAIDRAKELGIDTIVCDHHTMPKELPEKAILIHPLVPGETFPNKFLCGTAVAFKLASALYAEARKRGAGFLPGQEKWLLDLVAIATVTDMVPMVGENRVLETFGLLVLNKTKRPGLLALIEISGGKVGQLDTTSIGFQIGPRLNAAGRMKHANDALELLIEEDVNLAREKAIGLQEINKVRQGRSDEMYKEAKRKLENNPDTRCIILAKEGWSPGLVGLVAGKLLNELNIPVFVFGKEGEMYVGSGRSNGICDLMPALHAAAEHLVKYGGHPQACGLSIKGEDAFQKATTILREFIEQKMENSDVSITHFVDLEVDLNDVSWSLFEALEKCRPFGIGNPLPLFVSSGVQVVGLSTVGDGKHLRLSIQSPRGKIQKMIGFKFGDWISKIHLGDKIDVLFELSVNEWNGNRELQGRIVDLKISSKVDE